MIGNLNNRIKIYTVLFIALFISFMSLSSYSIFTKILTDDYIEKSVAISKQQSKNAAAAIKNIEEMSSIIITDLNLDNPQFYKSHDSSYIGALASYGTSCAYFTSFVVCKNNEILYYHIPVDNISNGIREIDFSSAVNINFNEEGIGWHIVKSDLAKGDFLFLVRKIPSNDSFIYIIFQVDTQYISDSFTSSSTFTEHDAVLLKNGDSKNMCRLVGPKDLDNKKTIEAFENTGSGKFSKDGKYTVFLNIPVQKDSFSFFIKDDISAIRDYTAYLAPLCAAVFLLTLIAAYLAVSALSKSMSLQLEKIRVKIQNYY